MDARTGAAAGHIAEGILEAAREIGADLIVMGNPRRRPLTEFLTGSVTAEVLHKWTGPVLVVPRPEREKLGEWDAATGTGTRCAAASTNCHVVSWDWALRGCEVAKLQRRATRAGISGKARESRPARAHAHLKGRTARWRACEASLGTRAAG